MACNNCISTQGFQKSCSFKQPGGNNVNIYIGNSCEWTVTDANADGVLDTFTDITVGGTATFYSVVANKDGVTTLETLVLPNKIVSQTVTVNISNIADDVDPEVGAAIQQEFLDELALNDDNILVIVKDRAGIYRLYGMVNGMSMENAEKGSGTVNTDAAQTVITLTAGEMTYAMPVAATAIATLPIA